ncbi:LOW QUALITY PROTEIN: WD repeat-containing protein 76 [Polymixia lowei]
MAPPAPENPRIVRRSTREAALSPKRLNYISMENVSKKRKVGHGGLSAYELERLDNIRQNQAFLSSIKLSQATEELKQLVRPKPSQRLVQSKGEERVRKVLPLREKSRRLQKKEAENLPLPSPSRPHKKPSGPLPMEPVNMVEGSRLPPELLKLCSEIILTVCTSPSSDTIKEKVQINLKGYRSALKKMRLTEDGVAKVVKKRIVSAAFHPCTSSLLMAAGDTLGHVGLWNLGGGWGDDGVLLFQPHSHPVGCMAFSRARPGHLLSLSYDGSLRCMDVEKAVFDDVYDIDDGLKVFDFLAADCSTLVVGDWYRDVAIVDRRTPGNSHESLHTLDTKNIHCVSVHPVHRQYFAVAESKVVSIYDSRCLKKAENQAVSQLHGHSLSISGAYFSPSTGNRVLTSCTDKKIRIYDTSAMTTKVPLLTSIGHDMEMDRWLSKFSAVWDPKREDCFAVGSMEQPRRVQVFHESGQLQHAFTDDEHLTTAQCVTAFHPSGNALLAGNAYGRLHVFTD